MTVQIQGGVSVLRVKYEHGAENLENIIYLWYNIVFFMFYSKNYERIGLTFEVFNARISNFEMHQLMTLFRLIGLISQPLSEFFYSKMYAF